MTKTIAILLMTLVVPTLLADERPVEVLTRSIKIIDEQGQPVAGAVADAWLINEEYFWPSSILPRELAKSDKDGVAQLRYPKNASRGLGDLIVESLKITVSHPDFLSSDVVVPVAGEQGKPFEIKLAHGVSLKLSAVDEQGKPVSEPFAVMATRMPESQRWQRNAPHQVQTRSIKSGNHQLMLVQPGKDGRDKFSSILNYHFNKAKEPEVVMEDIELLPGIAVRGKLSAEVPRPVKNGHVIAVHLPLPAGDSWDDNLPSLIYYSSTELREDGTFEFLSMPQTGSVQLITVCDGWVGLQDKARPFVVGETFDVDEADLDVELKMERTFDAKIRIVSEAGEPVEGVTVACSPNQLFQKGGATWLGERFDSMPTLKNQLTEQFDSLRQDSDNPFQAASDRQGRLVIRNLPRNRLSSRYSVWAPPTAPVRIETLEESVTGKLPMKDQNEVEFEIRVKVLKK